MSASLPRIEWADLPAMLAAALEPRVRRLGYLGEFFKCAANHPQALAAFMALTEASKEGLCDRLAEVIALTCSVRMGNDYERNQHEHLSLRLGFGRDWIAAVNRLNPHADSDLSADERLAQRLTLKVLDTRGQGARELFEEMTRRLGPRAAVAVLMSIGRCVAHGLIVNTLGLAAPVPSIFEHDRSG
jgi:alkylhydroperoxidase family enzyme